MVRTIRIVAWSLVGLLAVMVVVLTVLRPRDGGIRQLPGAVGIGGPFELTSHTGQRYSSTALIGRPYVIFFGFTHCPDVCPTKLSELTGLMGDLKADADRLGVLFVTVDPTRDTPELLRRYLSAFDRRIIGLTGTESEIAGVVRAYRVYAKRVPAGDGYTYDHTALAFLFDKTGTLVSTLAPEEASDVQLRKLTALLQR